MINHPPIPVNHDQEGFETLEIIAGAGRFNEWTFETIRSFIHGKTLEIGSGIGNISAFLLDQGGTVTLSDYSDNYIKMLHRRFSGVTNLDGIHLLDLVDPCFDEKLAPLLNSFDTIIALNVIEHIEDDSLAVKNAGKLLKPGGSLIILVPAYALLFNRFDKKLGHYRRYTKKALTALTRQHLSVSHARYFNLAGIAGWILSGSILKRRLIPEGQMKLFDRLVPLFKILDRLSLHKMGLSALVVATKK